MRWLYKSSIRRKLRLIIFATSSAALLLACAVFVTFDLLSSRRQIERDLATLAEITGSNCTAALTFNDPKAAREVLLTLSAKRQIRSACIYDREGRVFAKYRRSDLPDNFSPPAPRPDGSQFAGNRLLLFGKIALDREQIGTVYIEADLHELRTRLLHFAGIVAAVLLASSVVVFLLASKLQRVISEPILHLASTAMMVSERKNYSLRAVKQGQDELGFLVDRFNEMLAQIQQRDEELQQHRDHLEEEVAARIGELRALNVQLLAAKEKAETARAQTVLLLNSTAEAIFGIDLDGNVTFCNPSCVRLLGHTDPGALMGKQVHGLIHGSRPDGAASTIADCPILQACEKGMAIHREDESFLRADGTSFPVEYWTYPIHRGEEIVGAVITFVDITERKQLEWQFRQVQKMEAVGRLAGGVAHDFNNLLGVIIGYNDLLLDDISGADPRRKYVEEIRKATKRATSLTRQLLAFSRKQLLQPRVLDLNALVRDMEKMLRRMIGEDIDLTAALGSNLGCVKADPGQIEQVIMNMGVNARDAMPHGGRFIIETANADLDEAYARHHPPMPPGRYVKLAVSDTGCGMDAETQSHIFEPFFSTKEVGKGTGLGLSTVYGIVKQSGGYIWVYSEPGQGATFKIYLPRVDGAAPARSPEKTQTELPRASETVLLVEDESPLRELSQELLEGAGYTVLEAPNGLEAIQIAGLHNGPIHILLTDVVMPGMSGPELAARLVPLRPEMRVIYMSGYPDELIAHHGFPEAASQFLEKPFTKESILLKLRQVLDTVRTQ
jgi:PAS domain S-box-containing protein